jgi:ATP-dependent protease ClpP protease subunit
MKQESSLIINPRRCLFFGPNFSKESADFLITKLNIFIEKSKRDIYLKINTDGGDFNGARKLHSNIATSPCPVIGIVTGDAFSAALIALQACHRRYATKYSRFLIHQTSLPVKITVKSDTDFETFKKRLGEIKNETKKGNEMLLDILAERLTISRDQIKEMIKTGVELNAEEALKIGLIDEIIC